MELGELLKLFLIDLQSLFRSQTKDLKITLSQVILISSIPTNGVDMTTLAHQIGVDNSTLTRLIDVLIKHRYVTKNKNPKDGRSILVSLTQLGEKLQFDIEGKIDQLETKLIKNFDIEDLEEIKEILSNFHWAISKFKLSH